MNSNTTTYQPRIEKPWTWLSLMFSLFYFLPIVQAEPRVIAISTALYLVFVALYWSFVIAPKKLHVPLIFAMLGLGLFTSSVNPSASMFMSYGCFFAGFFLKKDKALVICTIALADLLLAAQLFGLWTPYYLLPGLFPIITLGFMGAFIQQDERHQWDALKNEKEKGQLVKTVERERIARDLHDTLGHTLTSITLKAELAKKLGAQGDIKKALLEISEVEAISRGALENVREVIGGYKHIDVNETLKQLTTRLQEAGFNATVHGSYPALKPPAEAALTFILTECVTNILRHSSGNQAEISLIPQGSALHLRVYDNGQAANLIAGNGLNGIKERLTQLDGTMTTQNTVGTSVEVTLRDAVYEPINS